MAGNDADTKAKSEDYLGYNTYAQTLWGRIERALQKAGDQPGDDPLVVGLFGEWGAGKSKLLQLIGDISKTKLEEQQKQTTGALKLTVPVLFQPWKYEHEPHLHVPLVMHVMQALREALKGHQGFVKRSEVAIADTANKGAKALTLVHHGASLGAKIFSPIKKTVAALSLFGLNINLPDEIEDWLDDVADATDSAPVAADNLAKKKEAKAEKLSKQQVVYSEDGLYFYRINEFLRKITRPGENADIQAQAQAKGIDKGTKINFVIFIDDLDRCLPEKAVETLELIKTVFNLESFAFVLALDEEVVERGIGHRYRDYSFEGKKPEMPITGFEYLEKIVHLPFRLPALTRAQAIGFMENYEELLLANSKNSKQKWFTPRAIETKLELVETPIESPLEDSMPKVLHFNLAHHVINSFTAYVPRKLIRVVELFHHSLDVLEKLNDEKAPRIDQVGLGTAIDVRILTSFILLQLFHPELYRCLRRSRVGFDVLRDAFALGKLIAATSDVDLWLWATHGHLEGTARAGKKNQPPVDLKEAILSIKEHDPEARYTAQQIYFPMVERLLDHRASQRHAFDPLHMFYSLIVSTKTVGNLPKENSQKYFGILSEQLPRQADEADYLDLMLQPPPNKTAAIEPPELQTGDSVIDLRKNKPIDSKLLSQLLLSTAKREQDSLPAKLGLVGYRLDESSATDLHQYLTQWKKINTKAEQSQRLQYGISVLAPYLRQEDALKFWSLLKLPDPELGKLKTPFKDTSELKQAHETAKLYSSLGQDQRFNPAAFHLAAPSKEKWLENFVNIPQTDDFELHSKHKIKRLPEFYIAKYLTTVDQFAHFVNNHGYGKLGGKCPPWWDPVGWLWRNGEWNNQLEASWAKESIKQRPKQARSQPMNWQEQLAVGSHPVMRLNWFEARAYCRWLDAQLKNHPKSQGKRFQVSLPTEAQWERAARAKNASESDARQYPWGDDSSHVELLANIDQSKLGEHSIVGLFPASPIGLYDLSGNLWEWQNNLSGKSEEAPLPWDLSDLKRGKDYDSSDSPALRGGSWFLPADSARASCHSRGRLDSWDGKVGFRVVLSLASSES